MKMTTKGKQRVDYLIQQAKEERDKDGYRENLGYDTIYELEDYLKRLALSYQEESEVTKYFYSECDKI